MRLRLRRLLPPDDPGDSINPLLDTLEARGLLSDRRFAVELSRVRSARFGAARVKMDLRARGVHDNLIREALAPLATSELERANALYARRFPGPARSLTERARRQRFLAGRGFSFETIRAVMGREVFETGEPDEPA